jgi:predicted thioesterase
MADVDTVLTSMLKQFLSKEENKSVGSSSRAMHIFPDHVGNSTGYEIPLAGITGKTVDKANTGSGRATGATMG